MKNNVVQQAIDIAGGQCALAEMVGVKQPSICKWLRAGVIPPRRVIKVEKLTGVPRYELNPDVYPRE